ncbi:SMP-30/gluconolactonase/LRE family protein [Luteimonas kalidii]|uniref:SMP-30/gluconolactonase/LRE family protein n=1 Tax=Luteimonas kalidii TaxID=3042025 RepID=A0ABT6JUQ4_9GAMM|nr:SMP-30/gluconolactonase/LRE family protein [Luteimonas kalidii]MDH5834428.1 SMP-30/gluconolactonase/LRE family protein [Luteimonas kalidii]
MSAAPGTIARLAVDSRCQLGEGIVWDDRAQCLYWTDILSRRLWRHVPDSGATEAWDVPEALGCLALCDDGRLLLALAKSIRIADAPVAGEPLALRTLAPLEVALGASTRSNDGRCDRDGHFVFGTKDETGATPPLGRFYQFSTAHGLRPLPLPPATVPNSLCFSPDGRTLYWCDSVQPRIWCGDYDAQRAQVSHPRVFAGVEGGKAPDGSTVDAAGGVWNAHWDGARAVRYAPDGAVDRIVAIPAGRPSCCAIGGAALDTLYVTTAREDLDDDQLARTPEAGGVFALTLAPGAGLPEARLRTA